MGLNHTDGQYTLVPEATTFEPGARRTFRFRITGPDGEVVRRYRTQHERDLHLIVVSRDLVRFQHVHPVLTADGTWEVGLTLPSAGPYRAFADFAPHDDEPRTLAIDLTAAGDHRPVPLAPAAAAASVDSLDVALTGEIRAGRASELSFTITEGDRPVTDLDPYLGAYGHLVAIRAGDLAYLHVHPTGEPGDGRTTAGPDVRFIVHTPSPGTYRLFLDFSRQGVVRTAAFTADVPDEAPEANEPPHGQEHH